MEEREEVGRGVSLSAPGRRAAEDSPYGYHL
jgi:hypothetical protein